MILNTVIKRKQMLRIIMFCKKIYSLKTYEIIIPTSYTHTYTHKKKYAGAHS